jgi:hypothetical protein
MKFDLPGLEGVKFEETVLGVLFLLYPLRLGAGEA